MVYIYDDEELREAYSFLRYMESRPLRFWGDEIKKEKREIRKYNKKRLDRIFRFHYKGDLVEKESLPDDVDSLQKAEEYFDQHNKDSDEFGVRIETINHKIVNRKGKFDCYDVLRITCHD